ncbi:hypothetical protein D3C86_2117450 [compost metagenome]
MTLDEFLEISSDYRGLTGGRPSVLFLDSMTGRTTLGHVFLIESWDTNELWSKKKYRDLIVPCMPESKLKN